MYSHLVEIRAHGPLTLTSAFAFESFYGEMRKCYVPETNSPLKQIMQKVLLKRILSHHTCQNSLFLSDYETSRENNSLVYMYKHSTYHLYQIIQVEEKTLECKIIEKEDCVFKEMKDINWSSVGVFKRGETSSSTVILDKKYVSGKLIAIQNLLITCPQNVLCEK